MPAAAAGQRAAVVAGYDDSDSARLAVRWAARHAAATKRSLDVVHAWVWPVFTSNLGPVGGVSGSGLRHAAETIRDSGAAIARAAAPGLTVTARMLPGLPAQVLQDAARGGRHCWWWAAGDSVACWAGSPAPSARTSQPPRPAH